MSGPQQRYISISGSFCITPDTANITDLNPQSMALNNAWFFGTVTAGAFVTSGTVPPGPATFSMITITQGTITALAQGLTQTVTWNNAAVTFVAKTVSITDSASNVASLIEDWQVGGVSQFNVSKAGNLVLAGNVQSSQFIVRNKSRISSSIDSQINITNLAATGFTRLTLGLETALFPSLKVNGASLQARLGDDSDYTDIQTANLSAQKLGTGLQIKTGANARLGTAVLVAGTIAVANTSVTANTVALITDIGAGGTLGNLSVVLTAGVGFTINSTNALDTSTIAWILVEQV